MILTVKVKLISGAYVSDDWEGTIEIDQEATLEDLHYAIQGAVGFDNDHMYEFFVSRTERSRDRIHYDYDNDGVFTSIEKIFPIENKRKLYYFFDFGDSWVFQVSKSRRKPIEPRSDTNYPSVSSEIGKRPQQYPDWE